MYKISKGLIYAKEENIYVYIYTYIKWIIRVVWNDEAHTIDRGITKNADTLRPVNENTTYHKPMRVIGNNPKIEHDFAVVELSAPSWQAACKIFPISNQASLRDLDSPNVVPFIENYNPINNGE